MRCRFYRYWDFHARTMFGFSLERHFPFFWYREPTHSHRRRPFRLRPQHRSKRLRGHRPRKSHRHRPHRTPPGQQIKRSCRSLWSQRHGRSQSQSQSLRRRPHNQRPCRSERPDARTGRTRSQDAGSIRRATTCCRRSALRPRRSRRDTIENLPQADNTPIDKVILQLPGVSYDSAVSNPNFHVRNEYANVQIRINGVVLPEGVSSLGPFLDTNFIGSMSLLTGTLPAQYGLRTAGVLDITSRSFAAPGGEISLYGGSQQTITPSFDYGGSVGNSEYFVTARGNWNALGLENPTPSLNAIHDETQQGKFFGYASTLLDEFDAPFLDLGGVLQRVPDPEQPRPSAARRFRLAERQFGNAQ